VLPAAVQRSSGADLATVVEVARRGVLPLLDRDGWIASLEDRVRTRAEPDPPTEAAFAQLVADTLHHVLLAARKLARGEQFVACLTLDGLLAARYVELAAWHARVVGGVRETWPAGRFLDAWADPRVLAALPEVTSRCIDAELRRALAAFLDAFEVIAVETAAALGHPYPHAAQRRVAALTAEALAG
jgi:aminoglycoside 6-adenylyltransferase